MHHELVDLQPAYAGAADGKSPDCDRADRQGPERHSSNCHRAESVRG